MIREEIEKLWNKGISFKIEVTSPYGYTTATVKSVIQLDDETLTFFDKNGERVTVRLSIITRVLG